MKSKLIIFLIIIFLILNGFLIFYLINDFLILDKEEIYAEVIVSDKLGIAINDSCLIFGSVIPGGTSSTKKIILKNNYLENIKVKIISNGEINDFLKVSENNFILKPNENKTLEFVIRMPLNISKGNYNGSVFILTKRFIF